MQKKWQAWTLARQALAKTVAAGGGGGDATDWRGVWRNFGREVGYETVAGTCFRGRGACTQYDPKVILGAKTLDTKGDAYYGFYRSHNL